MTPRPGRIDYFQRSQRFTRRRLLEKVWGLNDVKMNYLRMFVLSIRRKLRARPAHRAAKQFVF